MSLQFTPCILCPPSQLSNTCTPGGSTDAGRAVPSGLAVRAAGSSAAGGHGGARACACKFAGTVTAGSTFWLPHFGCSILAAPLYLRVFSLWWLCQKATLHAYSGGSARTARAGGPRELGARALEPQHAPRARRGFRLRAPTPRNPAPTVLAQLKARETVIDAFCGVKTALQPIPGL